MSERPDWLAEFRHEIPKEPDDGFWDGCDDADDVAELIDSLREHGQVASRPGIDASWFAAIHNLGVEARNAADELDRLRGERQEAARHIEELERQREAVLALCGLDDLRLRDAVGPFAVDLAIEIQKIYERDKGA